MKMRSAVVVMVFVQILALALSSCTHTYDIQVDPVEFDSTEKIDKKVALILTDRIRQTKFKREAVGDTYITPLGENIALNSERMAQSLFTDVVVLSDGLASYELGVAAILMPEVVLAERSRPVWAWEDAVNVIAIEWTLTSPDGAVIWIDTVNAESSGPWGNSFTREENLSAQLSALFRALFQESYSRISNSSDIRRFAQSPTSK